MSQVAYRLAGCLALGGLGVILPTEAMAGITAHAGVAAPYLDEALLAAALVGLVLLLDNASWRLMTSDR